MFQARSTCWMHCHEIFKCYYKWVQYFGLGLKPLWKWHPSASAALCTQCSLGSVTFNDMIHGYKLLSVNNDQNKNALAPFAVSFVFCVVDLLNVFLTRWSRPLCVSFVERWQPLSGSELRSQRLTSSWLTVSVVPRLGKSLLGCPKISVCV